MSASARDEYLAQQVLTAPPERLQLMLIEAAVSAAQRARTLWQSAWAEPVGLAILRCQKIVAQILGRLAVNSQDPLVGRGDERLHLCLSIADRRSLRAQSKKA